MTPIDAARNMAEALRVVVSHQKLLTRWPCPTCGRSGPDSPLRSLTVRTEDDRTYFGGCHDCNNDYYVELMERALGVYEAALILQDSQKP